MSAFWFLVWITVILVVTLAVAYYVATQTEKYKDYEDPPERTSWLP